MTIPIPLKVIYRGCPDCVRDKHRLTSLPHQTEQRQRKYLDNERQSFSILLVKKIQVFEDDIKHFLGILTYFFVSTPANYEAFYDFSINISKVRL